MKKKKINLIIVCCCFLVAVEMESGVVQLMVERVCTAMATCGRDPAVAVWAAKALANSAENGKVIESRSLLSN